MPGASRRPGPLGVALAIAGVGLAVATLANPFPYVPDDALFYLVIGRNVADGHGITFSQVMPTNGFQPLWQVLVAAAIWLAQLVGIDGDRAQLRVVIALGWACLVGGIVVVDRLLRRLGVGDIGRVAAAAIALVLLGGPYSTLATEANLVYLCAALLLLAGERAIRAMDQRSAALVGAFAGLTLLARVDTMFLVAAALAALVVRSARASSVPEAARRGATAAGAAGVVVAPYLAWNQVRFHHLLAISGAVKLRFDRFWFEPDSVGRVGWALLLAAVAAGSVAILLRRGRPFPWPWLVATVGAAGASGWYFAFSPGKLTAGSWYHAPHILAAALAIALATDAVIARVPALRIAAIVGAVAVLVAGVGFSWTERARGDNADQADAVLAFGAAAREALPADAVVATVDYPGYVALVTRRPTIALDGLTGSFDFQRDLRDHGGACTLERLGATHLVTDAPERLTPVAGHPGRYEQEVAAWLYDSPAGTVTVEDRTVTSEVGLELWRIVPSCP